jgi:protein SCO1/2
MKLSRALPWIVAIALLGALAGGIAARMLTQKPLNLQSGTWLPQPRALAQFQLTDLHGQPYGNAALNGHPTLLFFGYSNCPDVCPATLAMLHEVARQAPLAGLEIVFVSLDPERDTPATLRQYLAGFSSDFIGLTADQKALQPLLSSLSADATRQSLPGGGYRLSHTATLYLLDTHGHLVSVYSPPLATATLTADLRAIAQSAVL